MGKAFRKPGLSRSRHLFRVRTMADDLDEVRSKVAWADSQIISLERDVASYLTRNPYRLKSQTNRELCGDDIIFQVTDPIPTSIKVTVGAIIHAQRSSLDLLANVLAERNGAIEPEDCRFPITKSEQGLSDPRVKRGIKRLSTRDQQLIHELRPYGGGNRMLYALHWLDLKDKHSKLVTILTDLSVPSSGSVFVMFGRASVTDDSRQSFAIKGTAGRPSGGVSDDRAVRGELYCARLVMEVFPVEC